MRILAGCASVGIVESNGQLYVHDLQGSGNVSDMMRLIRILEKVAEKRQIHFTISNTDRTLSLLKRLGNAEKKMEIWSVDMRSK